jgi:hypothetical protein
MLSLQRSDVLLVARKPLVDAVRRGPAAQSATGGTSCTPRRFRSHTDREQTCILLAVKARDVSGAVGL